MPQHKGYIPPNKIVMTDFQKEFIIANFKSMDNKSIAKAVGLSKTYVTTYAYNLGLQREIIINWTKEQLNFFMENWRTIGNCELAEIINRDYPGKKIFKESTITKKMTSLGFKRNLHETFIIRERNRKSGRWGNPNPAKDGKEAPKLFIWVNSKTKVEVPLGKSIEEIQKKYSYLNKL